ncbi:hypothetical protein, partial [uncultured Parabacteroides sp.]
MKIHLLINVLILILFVQCVYKQKESISIEEKSVVETVQKSDSLPPLQAGEVTYKGDEPFGEIIVLKGRLLTSDTAIFRLKEAEMVIHDNILVLSPEIFEQLVLFKLPEMKCLGYVGSVGQG